MDHYTVFGGFRVDRDGVQIGHKRLLFQWQDGKKVIVWPEELAANQPRFPTPPWNQRPSARPGRSPRVCGARLPGGATQVAVIVSANCVAFMTSTPCRRKSAKCRTLYVTTTDTWATRAISAMWAS